MNSIRVQSIAILFASLLLFTVGLSQQEIIGFESRFYLFALEMWRHGWSWFPTTYQKPYADYPVTATGLIYLCALLWGGLNKLVAVFPSAFASAITVMTTYLIGATQSRRWALCSVLFLLFTVTFVTEARTISLDQFITAITTVCFYAALRKKTVWIFPLLVLGFAFRGPLGLVIPTGVVCIYYLLDRNYKTFFLTGIIAAILLILCSAAFLGLAYYSSGYEFMQTVLNMEFLGRMQAIRTPPFYFYFVESWGAYAITYPLVVAMLVNIIFKIKHIPAADFLQKLLGWALVILIGLSVPADKKVRYVLPMAPALALICGYLFVVAREQKYLVILRKVVSVFCFTLPTLSMAAVIYLHYFQPVLTFYFSPVLALLIILQGSVFLLRRESMLVLACGVFSYLLLVILVVEPINLHLNRVQNLVVQVEDIRHQKNAALAFYQEGTDGLVIKYLANATSEVSPIFAKTNEELLQIKSPVLIVATEENFKQVAPQSAFVVLFHGMLGREPVVVFSRNAFHQ